MSNGNIFIGEILGTAVLVLLGGGVCAAVNLKGSKAFGAGWVAVSFGWGFAVMAGAYISLGLSGGHLNPAVTLGIAVKTGEWSQTPYFLAGQILGAMIGAVLVWLAYYGHFRAHLTDPEIVGEGDAQYTGSKRNEPAGPVLEVFSTKPQIRNVVQNLMTEIIATIVLVLVILTQGMTKGIGLSGIGPLLTALTVVGIGLSLGGPTGYAINPVRDLGPRIVHSLLPLPNKGGSDWTYAWIPVVGPLLGGLAAGGIYQLAS